MIYAFATAPNILDEKGNDEETRSDGETSVNANFDNNGAQQQQVNVSKDLTNSETRHHNTSTVTDNSSKLVESVNQTTGLHLSYPVSMQQPNNVNDTTFANSTQQITSKPQPIYSSQKPNDTDTDMQPLLEIAQQTPDPPSTVDHLAKEEQKEANLSKLLIVYICLHIYVHM